jgi:hypothetical protein
MLKILLEAIRKSGGAELLDFVSPSFFDVVPVGQSMALIGRLVNRALQPIPPQKIQTIQDFLDIKKLPLKIQASKSPNAIPWTPSYDPTLAPFGYDNYGSVILKLYFSQIFCLSECVLDLRHQGFSQDHGHMIWTPQALFHQWDELFINSMREIYQGFYRDDKNLFRTGLARLNLSTAEELFLAHFGSGDQSQVSFNLAGFRKSFHDIFVHCKNHKIKLHADFLPLGILLGTLYENLSHLSHPLDVRKSFEDSI